MKRRNTAPFLLTGVTFRDFHRTQLQILLLGGNSRCSSLPYMFCHIPNGGRI